ncbi:adenylyl-sulfate kinase [bacterium]|nr:adenylyl-sulfate kinase [bacterium]
MNNAALKTEIQTEAAKSTALKLVVVGHVDHGKSTLIGRLMHDTGVLPDGKLEQLQANCQRRGMPFEWSFVLDALQAERDQGITIDTTRIWFKTPERDVVIIDAPGHKEFLKNMISGAAGADAAILVIDAKDGMQEQSRRHGYLLHLLGIRQMMVAVNKMDAVGYSEARFNEVKKDCLDYLGSIGVKPAHIIPIAAREGEGMLAPSAEMSWFQGPNLLDAIRACESHKPAESLPLRFPVQDVYKFDDRRIIAGRIESGSLKVGDTILVSPRNQLVKVKSIEAWGKTAPSQAFAGESVGITLDEQLFIERGNIISHVTQAPVLASRFHARIFWLGNESLQTGKRYTIKLATAEFWGEVEMIHQVLDTETLGHTGAKTVSKNSVAEISMIIRGHAALDDAADIPAMGRFVILDGYDMVGGGIVSLEGIQDIRPRIREIASSNITHVDAAVAYNERCQRNGHLGGVLWFTGLSGAGKSTIAKALSKHLFEKGYQVYVLDGDNLRSGLNSDLGFSPEDRSENIRRVGEVASLFADSGVIVISALISPTHADRLMASNACPDKFHTVYVKADVGTCEQRDVKGLYKKARAGVIQNFTGISAPYEEPEDPEVTLDTVNESLETCVEKLSAYVEKQLVAPLRHQ